MQALIRYLNQDYTWHKLILLCLAAFAVRFVAFDRYIQYEERYRQADSFDYHLCAACIKAGTGMTRFDTNEPIFWRTPGYPLFISFFYYWYDIMTADFSRNGAPQKAAIIVQIIICSLIPLLTFFLTRLITHSLPIAWISAWIAVIHLGFILASCFLLSDALAHVLFLLFLYFFYQSFFMWFEPHSKTMTSQKILLAATATAFFLGLYTWLRPNGQFLIAVVIIAFLIGNCSWRLKFSKIVLFTSLFFALLSGWYIRNYNLTGHIFFCPMSGPYLQTFCVPKILRRLSGSSLEECLKYTLSFVKPAMHNEALRLAQEAPHLYPCKEIICSRIAVPWVIKYPWYFLYDWVQEVVKTSFDLYASQLVSIITKTHMWDPAEEFLLEKLSLCLWKQPMPWFMRLICWLEALFHFFVWIGIFIGCWIFFLKPFITRNFYEKSLQVYQAQWIKMGIIAGALIIMTGGFGYARLRMAADPLLIIMSLTAWYTLIIAYLPFNQTGKAHEQTLRPMAHGLHPVGRKIKK